MTTSPRNIDVAIAGDDELGECPLWDDGELVWVDIPRGLIHRAAPGSGVSSTISAGEPVGSIALRKNGSLAVARASGFALSDAAGSWGPVALVEPELATTRLNDGRVDRQGRFLSGGVDDVATQRPISALYRLNTNGTVDWLLGDIACTNGLAFSPDGRTMYFADTPTRRIMQYRYDPDEGRPYGGVVFADLTDQPGLPDGSTVDADGCLWNAQWRGSRVVRYTPEGRIDRVIELPVSIPTCVTFGGSDLSTLFVTTARGPLSADERKREPLAGSILAMDLGVSGLPEVRYGG